MVFSLYATGGIVGILFTASLVVLITDALMENKKRLLYFVIPMFIFSLWLSIFMLRLAHLLGRQ